MGAEGVVIGILKPDGTLNMEQMKELMDAAGDMSVTLHRAFDVCADPIEAMEQAISLGIDTILTSGQKNTCLQGAELLKKLETRSQGRITIQAGSGVGAEVIRQLYPLTGIKAYHMSGKVVTDSAMQFRKEGVNMGLPTFSEYEIWRTDIENVRAAKLQSVRTTLGCCHGGFHRIHTGFQNIVFHVKIPLCYCLLRVISLRHSSVCSQWYHPEIHR